MLSRCWHEAGEVDNGQVSSVLVDPVTKVWESLKGIDKSILRCAENDNSQCTTLLDTDLERNDESWPVCCHDSLQYKPIFRAHTIGSRKYTHGQ